MNLKKILLCVLLILTGMIGAGTYIINKVKKDILKEQNYPISIWHCFK